MLPLLSFFYFFLFFVASLALSIYLSFVLFGIFSCVLFWDLLFVSSLGSFPHFKGNTLYIQGWRRSAHFYKVLIIKLKLYHDVCNVCLCQRSRICNDTSATCSNGVRAKPNYHASLRSRKSMYDNERSSHEKMDVAWWYVPNVSIIFACSMLILVILLYVLTHFHIIYNIFWTNLLIQCLVPVPVCFCPCIAEKGEK